MTVGQTEPRKTHLLRFRPGETAQDSTRADRARRTGRAALAISVEDLARFGPKCAARNARRLTLAARSEIPFGTLPAIAVGTVGSRVSQKGVRGLVQPRRDLHFLQVSLATDYAERLRRAGLRVTRPRITVLYAVHSAPHSEADTIIRAVHHCLPDVSRQAVYDSLHVLTSAGLLRRVQPAGLVARYEARVGDNHHHMVCRVCGAIADVDCAVGAAPCLTAADANGFQLDEAEVIYWGRCPECSEPDVPQALGDREPTKSFRDEVHFGSDARPMPAANGRPEQRPTTRPRHWVATSLANTPSTAAEVGTTGAPANAVLISFDVAGAALTGYGLQNLPSTADSGSPIANQSEGLE